MPLKIRFTLVFSVLIFIVLMVSAVSIYVLNENFRSDEFFKRIKKEGEDTYKVYYNSPGGIDEIKNRIQQTVGFSLTQQQVSILDSSYKPILSVPGNYPQNIGASRYETAWRNGEVLFENDGRETVILHKKTGNRSVFIVASAYDFFGHRKNDNLRIILGFTVVGGLLLAALLAYFFLNRLIKPLEDLQQQIQEIDEQNLTQRISIPNNNVEVARIGKSFNDMLNRLERGFEMRKIFVQHASHELRTPLATMLAQTEAALSKDLNAEECRQVLASLKEDQQQLIDLTNSLLLLSKYEQQGSLSDENAIRIDEVIYDTIGDVKQVHDKAIITVSFVTVPEDEDWLSIRGNESLIKSAIFNLIKNAIQYSDEIKAAVSIDATATGITLSFSNVGKQLFQQEQEKVFLPFFRGANSANKKGSGLGLSIVHRIVTLHKGTIKYTTGPGSLNSFIVFFPGTPNSAPL